MIASMFKIPDSTSQDWAHVLNTEFSKAYANLMCFLEAEKAWQSHFPQESSGSEPRNHFLHQIKCVIIGQDPTIQGQANGLAFTE